MKQTVLHGFIAVVCLSISLTAAALQTAAEPTMTVLQPEYVSATGQTPVTCRIQTSDPADGTLAVYLLQPADGAPVRLLDCAVSLKTGRNDLTFSLDPESLHSVPLFGDFSIRLVLSLAGGGRATAELESTLLPQPSRSLTSRWSIGFTGKPALLYTTSASAVDVGVSSPKSTAKAAKIKLKFMDERGRNKVKLPAVAVTLVPGENTIHLTVPAGAATLASQRGDVRGKVVLKVGGVVKATDEAPLDYDLAADASADATSGRAPLDVTFQAEASGGSPPYAYTWDFGDGTSSDLQNPDHTYDGQGSFPAAVTVTDGLGGAVTRTIEVSVDYPELLVGCQAAPTDGTLPLTVSFSASAQGGNGDYAYAWDFGDGTRSSLPSPGHTYSAAGSFDARLTVTSGNQTATCSETIIAVLPTYILTASAGPGGTITPSGSISVEQGGNLGFAITPEAGYAVADVRVDDVSIGAVAAYTFRNVRADHTISATFTRISYVVTVSAGPGGSVSPSGSVSVYEGDGLDLTVTPDTGFAVKDVSVDGVSVGPALSYRFENIQSNHRVDVSFERAEFTVTASAGPGGGVNPSGTVSLARGGGMTFHMTPDAGYYLDDLLVDGASVGPFAAYTFSDVQADHTLRALFSKRASGTFVISSLAGPGGSIAPAGALPVQKGEDQALAITPDAGCHIVDVRVDGAAVGPLGHYAFTDVQADHTILATFARDVPGAFLITATAGAGGSIDPSGATTVLPGADQVFTITADPLFAVQDVQIDGISIGAVTRATFTDVQSDHTIHATFVRSVYLIAAAATPGGTLDPAGDVEVAPGDSQAFTLTPDPDYRIADLKVDGVSQGPLDAYTFSDVHEDHTVEAVFEPDTLAITVGVTDHGTIAPSGTVNVLRGNDIAFIMTPDSGYRLEDVEVDGTSVGPVTPYWFYDVQTAHTISATFVLDVPQIFIIHSTAGSGGSISPGGDVSVVQGNYQVFIMTPDTGYVVSNVSVDGLPVGAVPSYTFYNVQEDHTIHADFAPSGSPRPAITGLQANPGSLADPNGSCTVTFTVSSPDGSAVTWTATLSGATATGNLGTLNTSTGTVPSGTQVTVLYERGGKTGSGAVTVTINASNGTGMAAVPQSVSISLF